MHDVETCNLLGFELKTLIFSVEHAVASVLLLCIELCGQWPLSLIYFRFHQGAYRELDQGSDISLVFFLEQKKF